jgi:hypothetical protein
MAGALPEDFSHLWQYLSDFFLEMFQIKVVEKIKTHILCSVTFFSENHAVCEIMSENIVETEGQKLKSQYDPYVLDAG